MIILLVNDKSIAHGAGPRGSAVTPWSNAQRKQGREICITHGAGPGGSAVAPWRNAERNKGDLEGARSA